MVILVVPLPLGVGEVHLYNACNDLLEVVDGIQVEGASLNGSLGDINIRISPLSKPGPSGIESIEILKDTSSCPRNWD